MTWRQEDPEKIKKKMYCIYMYLATSHGFPFSRMTSNTVKILKFGTSQTSAITVLKIEKFDVTLH